MPVDSRYSAKLVVCLTAVYLIWGASFVFTEMAATHLPIALFSAVRFLTAGAVFASNGLNAWAIQLFMAMQLWCGGLMLLLVALLHGDTARWTFGAPGIGY